MIEALTLEGLEMPNTWHPLSRKAERRWWWVLKDDDGRLVGTAALGVAEDLPFLEHLMVCPSHRGQGLGAELVWAVLRHAKSRDMAQVYLTCPPINTPYFAMWGFQPVSLSKIQSSSPYTLIGLSLAMPLVQVRAAKRGDAKQIAQIYNQGIQDRMATFETAERSEAERIKWLKERDPRYRVLVAVGDLGVVGWLSLNPFSTRPVYRLVADVSIYVERNARRSGIGSRLLKQGLREARNQGFHKLVLTLFPENHSARALYLRHGFRSVGVLHQQGMLDGIWRDTEMMENILLDNGQ